MSANAVPANPDVYETHVVAAGETLSQIADVVLKDSKLWPQLWEMNEHIVNPHWIYPADKILIRPITKITEAVPPPVPAPVPAPPVEVAATPAPVPVPVPASRGIAVLRNLIGPPSTSAKVQDIFDLPAPQLVNGIKASDMYCSGFIRSTPVPDTLRVSSTYQDAAVLSTEGEYVHINRGNQGRRDGWIGIPGRSSDGAREGFFPNGCCRQPWYALSGYCRDSGCTDGGGFRSCSHRRELRSSRSRRCNGSLVYYDVPSLPRNRPFSPTMTTSGQLKGSVVFMKNIVASSGTMYRTSADLPIQVSIVAQGGVIYINVGKGDNVKSGDIFIVYRGKICHWRNRRAPGR